MDPRTNNGRRTKDHGYPIKSRKEANEFLSCAHLLSDEEILEFLSLDGGDESRGDEKVNTDGTGRGIAKKKMPSWKSRKEYCCERTLWRRAFRRRTAEIRALASELRDGSGRARIDEDGRLVPVFEPPQPPRADLPPPGRAAETNAGNNNNNNNNNLLPGNQNLNNNNNNNPLDPQQENPETRFLDQLRRQAENTISIAVTELRHDRRQQNRDTGGEGKDEDEDFEVILLDPKGQPVQPPISSGGFSFAQTNNNNNNNNNAANNIGFLVARLFRRIVIVLMIAAAAVGCAMLQILPLYSVTVEDFFDSTFDALLYEVLEVRDWRDHVLECTGGLANRSDYHHHLHHKWGLNGIRDAVIGRTGIVDCSKGVLHIPSERVLISDSLQSLTATPTAGRRRPTLQSELRDYAYGVNASWFMSCSGHPTIYSEGQQYNRDEAKNRENQCTDTLGTNDHSHSAHSICNGRRRIFDKCFRGIHDHFATTGEVRAAFSLANELVDKGGDHFDVHYDVSLLTMAVPSVVDKVRNLLETSYFNGQRRTKDAQTIEPVAFRVLTTGPMDGHDVQLKQTGNGMSMYLTHSSALNEENYLNWVLRSRQHNDQARFQSKYRPWPFRLEPKRDTCDLKFDLGADSRFCILTTIHLTTGAGENFQGGTSLFVDDHPSNARDSKRRIARGVSVDSSRGRLVVSTGGNENLRCRFPVRSGFRTELQIWWNCEHE